MKRRREMEMELKMRSELRSAIEEFSKEALKVQPVDDQVQNAAAHIPLKPFLFLCNMVLQVLDKIGPTMAVLRQDIHQNIQRLEKFQESNPLLYSNVVEILKKEKNEVSARHVASCSRAFVWLTRSLNFTVTLLRLLLKDSELKMERAVEEAYIITLKPWHGWITSTAYKLSNWCLTKKHFLPFSCPIEKTVTDLKKKWTHLFHYLCLSLTKYTRFR
ncbi:glycolipid transfer protein 2-like isoform X2 [Apium graveolens]|uniref:glycolipid transfer protein 2-like isoform X2 n=1 Tax=Apium graveolens TaxID=4045 RepID=UPI003D7BDE26